MNAKNVAITAAALAALNTGVNVQLRITGRRDPVTVTITEVVVKHTVAAAGDGTVGRFLVRDDEGNPRRCLWIRRDGTGSLFGNCKKTEAVEVVAIVPAAILEAIEDCIDADADRWEDHIRATLTRLDWDDPEASDRALTSRRQFLVARVGMFPEGDKAFNRMNRAGEIVQAGMGGGANTRWALRSEIAIEAERKAEREAKREARRNEALDSLLEANGIELTDANRRAVRLAYEAGRDSK